MLCGAAALGLETGGSVCLALAGTIVLYCCSVGLGWAGAVALDFRAGFSVELVGAEPEVLPGG